MANESAVIRREEAKEPSDGGGESGSHVSPIRDAQSDVEKTFFFVGGAALLAALLAGYLLAARTAAPLRRFADTAAEVDADDLSPRLELGPEVASELRTVADAFNHMLPIRQKLPDGAICAAISLVAIALGCRPEQKTSASLSMGSILRRSRLVVCSMRRARWWGFWLASPSHEAPPLRDRRLITSP